MRTVAIVLILDGLNAKVLEEACVPRLKELMKQGTALKIKSIIPSVTYSAHASIVTGVSPKGHGLVGNSFLDRKSERIISLDYEPIEKLLLTKTIFQIVERAGLKTASISEPVPVGASIIAEKAVFDKIDAKKRGLKIAERVISVITEENPALVVANFSNFDTLGETKGPFSDDVLSALEEFDAFLPELEEVLKEAYDDYLLVITADHGMTNIEERIDISKELEGVLVLPSHRVAHIYTDDTEWAVRVLKDIGAEVFKKEEVEALGLHEKRSGDLVAFAPPGVEFEHAEKGSHGGLLDDEMVVWLIANKPDLLIEPRSIVDVFHLVLEYIVEGVGLRIAAESSKSSDPGHGFDHVQRVLRLVTSMGLKLGADVRALRLAAIFHDISRGRNPKGHENRSARVAETILRRFEIPDDLIKKVVMIIKNHHADPASLETLEEKIFWDADKLDCLGAIGIVRALLESGWKKESFKEAFEHVERDLKAFINGFHFPETKEEAMRRLEFFKKFVQEFERESRWS